jgi:hypothetical protein
MFFDPQLHLPSAIADEAHDAVTAMLFRPFERHGYPVWVSFPFEVAVLPPEDKPSRHVPFPAVNDWKSVTITLSRTGCFGACPAYSVDILGNGSVVYDGKAYVAVKGVHNATISHESLAELVDAFRKADFFSLHDEYVWGATDLPTYEISIEIEGRSLQGLPSAEPTPGS